MRRTILFSLLIFGLVVVFVLPALAQPPKAKVTKRMIVKKGLDLSEKQIEKIRDINLDTQKEAIRLRADLKISKLEMHRMMQESSVPKGEIFKKVDEISTIQNKLEKNQIEKQLALREVLTPEQFKKFQQLQKERLGKGIKERIKKRIFLRSNEPTPPPQGGWKENSILEEEFVPLGEAPEPLEEEESN
jgi:Spy/CpxP family protein refolding chaperone